MLNILLFIDNEFTDILYFFWCFVSFYQKDSLKVFGGIFILNDTFLQ